MEQARHSGIARSANAAPSPVHGAAVNAFGVPIRDAQASMVLALAVVSQAERLSPDPQGEVPLQPARAAAQIEAEWRKSC